MAGSFRLPCRFIAFGMMHQFGSRLAPGPPLMAEWTTIWHTGPAFWDI